MEMLTDINLTDFLREFQYHGPFKRRYLDPYYGLFVQLYYHVPCSLVVGIINIYNLRSSALPTKRPRVSITHN